MNSQGSRVLNLVNDTRCCILNGRVTPKHDDFTSCTAHKGHAVVDYLITRQSELDAVTKVQINSCNELIDSLNLMNMLGPGCRAPDHSLLTMQIELSMVVRESLVDKKLRK